MGGCLERKCEISGKTFSVSPIELGIIQKHGLPNPRRSEVERLRFLLSMIPDLGTCLKSDHGFFINPTSNFIPSVNINSLSPVAFTLDTFPELSGELCFRKLTELLNCWKLGERQQVLSEPNYFCFNCKDIYDTYFSFDSHSLVECIFVTASHKLVNARYSTGCDNCFFIENCEDCSYCLFSSNLKGEKFFVFNQRVSEEEYFKILSSLVLTDSVHFETSKERYANYLKTQVYNVNSFTHSEQISGRFINSSHNVDTSYFSHLTSNSSLIFGGHKLLGSVGLIISGGDVKDSYQSLLIRGPANGVRNSYLCGPNVAELDYCIACKNSSDLMFCVGLENVKYCIFNQQFSEKDYFTYKKKVKKNFLRDIDWGVQLPSQVSLIGYNESLANLFFPLSKVQANLLGFEWNADLDLVKVDREASSLRVCDITGERFEIDPLESKLRHELGIAEPTRSANQRFHDLMTSVELGPKRESRCGLRSKTFSHYYKGTRLVIS